MYLNCPKGSRLPVGRTRREWGFPPRPRLALIEPSREQIRAVGLVAYNLRSCWHTKDPVSLNVVYISTGWHTAGRVTSGSGSRSRAEVLAATWNSAWSRASMNIFPLELSLPTVVTYLVPRHARLPRNSKHSPVL